MRKWIQRFKMWCDWRKRASGRDVVDWVRGCGYYLPGQFCGYNRDIGRIETHDLRSGKRGVFKLLYVKTFHDPPDMINYSNWQLLGYEDQKPFSLMSFREYCEARLSIGNFCRREKTVSERLPK